MLQGGCAKEKTMIITNDVSKGDPIIMSKLKVEERVINLKIDKESSFFPLYWKEDKMVGMIENDGELNAGTQDKEKSFYELDSEGSMKETDKKSLLRVCFGDRGVGWKTDKDSLYYYDFTDGKTFMEKLITPNQLFEEIAIGSIRSSSDRMTDLVQGNEKYMLGIIYMPGARPKDRTTSIKLFDIDNKKLYKSENLNNMVICNIVYLKELKEFIAIENTGQTYKVSIFDNKIKLEKFKKIDLGSHNGFDILNVSLVADDTIAIKNIGALDFNGILSKPNILMMTYNFKNNKIEKIIRAQNDEDIRIEQYYHKQNLAVVSKRSPKDKSQIESIYLAKITENEINYIYKLNNDVNEGESCFQVTSIINESGDKLFIERWVNPRDRNDHLRKVVHFCDIK